MSRPRVAHAYKARQPQSTGGTSAPRSAAGGPYVAPAHGFQQGIGPARPVPVKAAPTNAAPKSPGNVMPWDTRYEEEIGGSRKKYLDTVNNLDSAQVGVEQDYGLSPTYNDYQSNPYSRAALLESQYQKANRGTLNSAGYQLYSGSAGNHLAANRGSYDINRNELEKTYNAALGEIGEKKSAAKEAEAEEEREAAFGRNERAEKAPLDPSQAPPARKHKQGKGGNKGGNNGGGGQQHPKKGKRR